MNDWKIIPVKITCHSQFVKSVLERSCSVVSKSWFLVFLFLWGSLLVLVNCATISACLNEERKRLTKCYKAASNSLDNNVQGSLSSYSSFPREQSFSSSHHHGPLGSRFITFQSWSPMHREFVLVEGCPTCHRWKFPSRQEAGRSAGTAYEYL